MLQRLAELHIGSSRSSRPTLRRMPPGTSLDELEPGDHVLVGDCCSRISIFLSYVERHEERENHVILCVFAQDIGTKD